MKILKKFFLILLFTSLLSCAFGTISMAGYQSRPEGKRPQGVVYANDKFVNARKMEAKDGVLGLDAQIDETSFLDVSINKNGLDCHMAKNTEWGTTIMLAKSSYGKSDYGKSKNDSTTGNATGVNLMCNNSYYVSGIFEDFDDSTDAYMNKIRNADSRYFNLYPKYNSDTFILGDAFELSSKALGPGTYSMLSRNGFAWYNSDGDWRSNYGIYAVIVNGAGL